MSRSREVSWHSLIAPSTGLPAIGDDRRGNVVAPRKVNVLETRGQPTVRVRASAHGTRKIALHYVRCQTLTGAALRAATADDGSVCLTNSNLKPVPDHRVGLFDARKRSCRRTCARQGHIAARLFM